MTLRPAPPPRPAVFASAALAFPAFMLGAPLLASPTPPPAPYPTSAGDWSDAMPASLPVSPSLELAESTWSGEPVAGQDYPIQVAVTNAGRSPARDTRLSIRLSEDTVLTSVPDGCAAAGDELECEWSWVAAGEVLVVPLTVRPLYGGSVVAVGSVLRYDWDFVAYAKVIRFVQCPPAAPSPPPVSSPPPTTPPPSPVPSSPPPSPSPSPRPQPVRRVVKVVVPPPPVRTPPPPRPPLPRAVTPTRAHTPTPRKPAPRPPKATPRPTAFPHMAELPVVPPSAPKPVLPLGVLITAVLTPCVAAAATRFGKR